MNFFRSDIRLKKKLISAHLNFKLNPAVFKIAGLYFYIIFPTSFSIFCCRVWYCMRFYCFVSMPVTLIISTCTNTSANNPSVTVTKSFVLYQNNFNLIYKAIPKMLYRTVTAPFTQGSQVGYFYYMGSTKTC